MENKENYIRNDIVKSVKKTIVEIFNCNNRSSDLSVVDLIVWTADNKIKSLKEFGCNLNNYNPYEDSDTPKFRDEKTSWF